MERGRKIFGCCTGVGGGLGAWGSGLDIKNPWSRVYTCIFSGWEGRANKILVILRVDGRGRKYFCDSNGKVIGGTDVLLVISIFLSFPPHAPHPPPPPNTSDNK